MSRSVKAGPQTTRDVKNCTCGFYDAIEDLYFTESIILYFNESHIIPSSFLVEEFEHRFDRGWNNKFRIGASVNNTKITQDSTSRNMTSLQLACQPADRNHLVTGSSIRTSRQDIFFGSFRAGIRPARPWMQGSVISMGLTHNQTESWQIDIMNTNNSRWAWVDMLMQSEFPNTWRGINFSSLQNEHLKPWHYLEYRVDWSRQSLQYYIDNKLRVNYNTSTNSSIPSTPAPLRFQHWSVGNKYSSMGPPSSTNLANIKYVRLFFNSSSWNDTKRAFYNQACSIEKACHMDDISLRGATGFETVSLLPWKQAQPPYTVRWVPLIIDIIFVVIFVLLTVKALWRRLNWRQIQSLFRLRTREISRAEPSRSSLTSNSAANSNFHPIISGSSEESEVTCDYVLTSLPNSTAMLPVLKSRSYSSNEHQLLPRKYENTPREPEIKIGYNNKAISSTFPEEALSPTERTRGIEAADNGAGKSTKASRVDYLAGFISISAVLVSVNHFCLTFLGAAIMPQTFAHYPSEVISRTTFATYFLNPLWIGPFLMISTRFLTSNYILTGNLENMAQKIVARPFRLLTPVACIAFLEYFLMDAGALYWLEYLPSVTWSDWPFAVIPRSLGSFISEILQLAFLIPNAAPMVTSNYCTGVLWTIPVQLQGTWQTLLGLIMIRQMKTFWKRISFYIICAIMHWYALSWGSYYYLGILLADLDITYKYRQKWLYPRLLIYWPVLFFLISIALGGFTLDLISQRTGVNYAQVEYGWHPDARTGLALTQVSANTYPDYFIPRLNAILATVAMQGVVEISPFVQRVLSLKLLQWLFPHVFSIYLIHGFLMWSVGSWIMISIFSKGLPYWLCALITAIVCYCTIFAALPIITPPIETLGKGFTQRLWQFASSEPIQRKPTTYPFGVELLTSRHQLRKHPYNNISRMASLGPKISSPSSQTQA